VLQYLTTVFSADVGTTAGRAVAAAKAATKTAVVTVSGFTVNGTSPRRYSPGRRIA
jgi:hypothetical protein